MKNFIFSIIALLGILMPNTVWAQEPYAALSEDNTVLTFYYDDQKASRNGMDIGPFEYMSYPLSHSGWDDLKANITTAKFDASFANCTSITSTAFWFYECTNLKEIIDLSNLKTDNVTDMRSMFERCQSLTSIDVSGFNTESVTTMGDLFYGCSSLTSLDISGFNTDKVTDMGFLFGSCTNLTNVNVKNLSNTNVTNMNSLFSYCDNLESIDISGFKTDNVTSMNDMFKHCTNLKSLDLSGFNTENVTTMNDMFWYCENLTSLDLSNWSNTNVTDMEAMFSQCTSLTDLNLSGFKTDNVTTMNEMFYGCSSLTSLDLSGFNTDKVEYMGSMFRNCTNLTSLNLSNWSNTNTHDMGSMFSECTSLSDLNLSGFKADNVSYIADMFYGCSSLTSLDLSGFNTDKVAYMRNVFNGCSNLTSLDLSNFKTDNVSNMEYLFYDCSRLRTIFVSDKWSNYNVTESEAMFAECTHLIGGNGTKYDENHIDKTYARIDSEGEPGYFTAAGSEPYVEPAVTEAYAVLEVSTAEDYSINDAWITLYYDDLKTTRKGTVVDLDKMTESPEIMQTRKVLHSVIIDPSFADARPTSTYYWFGNCFALKTISGLEYLNTSEVTTMECMFMDCPELTELDLSHFETSKVTSMNNMFYGFSGTTLDLSTFDTSNVTDMSFMFGRCENLTTIYVSDKWTTANVTSGDAMFAECTKLVGGNGTKYDENHTDPLYARIDTERAPGYFTDIADKGKEKMEQVETPYWNFEEDSLVLYNITEGATIYYEMKSWETQEQADSLANGMTVDTSSNVYSKAIAVEDNFVLKMFAAKEGMENSNDTTFIYNYKIWKQLQEVVKYGDDILYKAKESGKVDSLLLMELDEGIMDGYRMYHHRAFVSADQAQVVIENLSRVIKQVEEQLYATSEQVATPIFKFADNLLELFTETIDAKIYYAIQEFDNNLETDTIAKYARNLQVSVDSIEYKGQIEANFDFILKAMAVKEGMEDSEEATLIYPFTEWQNMLQTIDIGNAVFSMILDAEHSDEVAKLIEDVQMRMAEVESVYNNSRTEWDRETVRNEREYLKSMIDVIHNMWQDEQSQKTTAKYENHILTVEGDVSMAQALEQVGGRNVVAKDIAAIVWNSSEAITRSDIEGFGNPNMLIYVQTDSIAPEGVNNVVIDGKAKSIILVDADSTTNNNFYAPMAFTAESIQYTREFKQTTEKDVSRGWEGICLPFTVQKFTHESHGEIAPFGNDASIFHFWLHQMTDKGMVNANTIEANKPYIISMPNNGSYPEAYNQAGKVTFSAENATVPASDNTAIWSADGTIGMMSTYLRIEPSEHFYALNVGNAMEGYAEGSVFVQNLRDVKPFEVYTFHEPSRNEGAGARFISVSSLFGGEGTTGIIDIMKAIEPNGETWYDMNGRRLQSKPSRKGVYIMNGKKVVVK